MASKLGFTYKLWLVSRMLHFILSGQFLGSYNVYTGMTVVHQLQIQLLPLYISLNLPVSTPWIPFPPLNLPISTPWIKYFQLLIHTVVTKCSCIIPVIRVLSEVKKCCYQCPVTHFVLTHTILRVVLHVCSYRNIASVDNYVPMCTYTVVTYYVHI